MVEYPKLQQKKVHAQYREATAKRGRNSVTGILKCHHQKLSPLSKPRNEARTLTAAFQWADYTNLLKSMCLFLRHGDFAFTSNFGFISNENYNEIYQ